MSKTHPGRTAGRFFKTRALAGTTQDAINGFLDSVLWTDAGVIRSAIGAQTVGDWGSSALLEVEHDFAALVRKGSLVGRLVDRGLLRVLPDRTPTIKQNSGAAASWVAEGDAVAMGSQAFERLPRMDLLRVSGASVVTQELLGIPGAEDIVLDDLAEAVAEEVDRAFTDPANAGQAGIRPASIFNGAPSIPASGVDAEALVADLGALVAAFPGRFERAVWVATAAQAARFATLIPPPAIDLAPGREHLMGRPLFISDLLPSDSSGGIVGLVDPSRIQFVGFARAELELSLEASFLLDDAPTMDSTTPTAAQLVSLWQAGAVGALGTALLNWRAIGAAAYIDSALYGG